MSGHNKWSKVKNIKAVNDAQNSKIFTKLGREIAVAVKESGSDPASNSKLKTIIAKCKAVNMPNDNINRSIKKASGELGAVNYERMTYEGYGVGGSAVIVNALTDNKNRTASDVRHYFEKMGGSLGSTGCVSYMFNQKGVLIILKDDKLTEDDIMMHVLESGASDYETDDEVYTIYCAPTDLDKVSEYFANNNINVEDASVDMIPTNYVTLDESHLSTFTKMYDGLNDLDDVQEIFHNVDNFDE